MKRPLHAVMGWPGPETDRQLQVWIAWRDWEWNRPGRLEHYVMQNGLASGKSFKEGTKLHELKLKFPERAVKEPAEGTAVDNRGIKNVFLGMFGFGKGIQGDNLKVAGRNLAGETEDEVGP